MADAFADDLVIRKVKTLQGRARDKAKEQELEDEDLVILRTSVNSLPEYEIEKIEGDPLSYLQKKCKG